MSNIGYKNNLNKDTPCYVNKGLLMFYDAIIDPSWNDICGFAVHRPDISSGKMRNGDGYADLAVDGPGPFCVKYEAKGLDKVVPVSGGKFTLELCFSTLSVTPNQIINCVHVACQESPGYQQQCMSMSTQYYYQVNRNPFGMTRIKTPAKSNTTQTLTAVMNEDGTAILYRNGVLETEYLTPGSAVGQHGDFIIFGNISNTHYGRYRSMRFYDRQLTAEEIAFNYDSDKERFGI